MFSSLLNDPDFSQEIRLCHSGLHITLYHPAKNFENPKVGSIITFCDKPTIFSLYAPLKWRTVTSCRTCSTSGLPDDFFFEPKWWCISWKSPMVIKQQPRSLLAILQFWTPVAGLSGDPILTKWTLISCIIMLIIDN